MSKSSVKLAKSQAQRVFVDSSAKGSSRSEAFDHLIKSKWTIPLSVKANNLNSNLSKNPMIKNVTINGKTLPLKVMKIIPADQALAGPSSFRSETKNVKTQNILSFSQKGAVISLPVQPIKTRNAILTSVTPTKNNDSALITFPFPLNEVKDLMEEIEKKIAEKHFRKKLAKYLKAKTKHADETEIVSKLLDVVFTPTLMDSFNMTGKFKMSFKKLKINKLFQDLSHLDTKTYKRELTRGIQNMHSRFYRLKTKRLLQRPGSPINDN